MEGLHHGAQAFAHIGGGGEAGGRLLLQAAQDHGFKLDGQVGHDFAEVGRVGELGGANGLELGCVGTVEGMAAAGELVKDEAESEDVGLDGGAAGDELLGGHVGDGAALGGVGCLGRERRVAAGSGGVKVGLVAAELTGKAKVEDLDEAAVGEHDVGGLEVAMEDADQVRGGEAVGDLDAGRKDKLQTGGALGDDLVQGLAGNVLHDDVGFVLLAAGAGLGGSFADVVDGADVGVVDGGGEAGLAELGGTYLLERLRAALEQLEDDGPLQEVVRGQIDDAAAAGADFADELVVPDCAALHTLIIAGVHTPFPRFALILRGLPCDSQECGRTHVVAGRGRRI